MAAKVSGHALCHAKPAPAILCRLPAARGNHVVNKLRFQARAVKLSFPGSLPRCGVTDRRQWSGARRQKPMAEEKKIRVLILGGGFGGTYAALEMEKRLARRSDVEVVLVDRQNFMLFTPMLHEVAASDLEITTIVSPIRQLLKRVTFLCGQVSEIDL
ncbi:MAG TPA: FAD-dependent oxidoreductase, partial [Chroococcales cyanobacterium]